MYRTAGAVVAGDGAKGGPALTLDAAPNPAAGAVALTFALDAPADATLAVYDALGRRVDGLAAGAFAAGSHRVVWDARRHAPAAYVAVLETGGRTLTRRMAVVR